MTIAQKIAELAEALGVDIPNDGQIADNLNAITLAKGGTITSNTNISEAIKNLANTIGGNGGSDDENPVSSNGVMINLLSPGAFDGSAEYYLCIIATGNYNIDSAPMVYNDLGTADYYLSVTLSDSGTVMTDTWFISKTEGNTQYVVNGTSHIKVIFEVYDASNEESASIMYEAIFDVTNKNYANAVTTELASLRVVQDGE